MKHIQRYCVMFFAIVLLFSLVPFQTFADPVTSSVIANAFAQAIASYGAANGVALTFDVSSTDGIGETVHELWKDFREGTQTADDYATIAQAIFPELYYKSSVALGTASDVYAVGVHISDTYAETLDDFYNWLLSGPAEMVQVDNQYFQFSQAQIGPNSDSILVGSFDTSGFHMLPVWTAPQNYTVRQLYESCEQVVTFYMSQNVQTTYKCCNFAYNNNHPVFIFYYTENGFHYFVGLSQYSGSVVCTYYEKSHNSYSRSDITLSLDSSSGLYIGSLFGAGTDLRNVNAPYFPSRADGIQHFLDYIADPQTDDVGVKAYNPSGLADIPDTADPNYDALNRAKDIPLNIPWDDAIYGDGTGTLTDAQSAAIASDLAQALETDRSVELVEEKDIPIQPDYSDVLLPLIPINVPSFNFSLSGIWHYVRSWVTSLGAWLSMMFSIWGILPYAIVVPVYACLVIVIVLGLYKRFFM